MKRYYNSILYITLAIVFGVSFIYLAFYYELGHGEVTKYGVGILVIGILILLFAPGINAVLDENKFYGGLWNFKITKKSNGVSYRNIKETGHIFFNFYYFITKTDEPSYAPISRKCYLEICKRIKESNKNVDIRGWIVKKQLRKKFNLDV